MVRLCFEQHVRILSGHGCPAIYEAWQSEKFWPSEVPPRWGGTSGAEKSKPCQPLCYSISKDITTLKERRG